MKLCKRILGLFLVNVLVVLTLIGCGNPTAGTVKETMEETIDTAVKAEESTVSDDIVILYTNDVHTYVDGPISYDVIAAIKKELQEEYEYVYLVDAGDHIQGTAYGSMDNGETIIKMMNAAGYDVATLGNHEFDYGMFGCMKAIDMAEYPYVSCNFHNEADGVCGENVLNSYELLQAGEETIAVIGITTPEISHFQDEEGNFIYGYGIAGGDDGSELYAAVQKAIEEAKEAGATKVIALGHLGDDISSTPWTSEETIANVCGFHAFIDGHSHSVVEGKEVSDRDGHKVLLTQTGQYFDRIGMMVIDGEDGSITTDFIEYKEILAADNETVEGYELCSNIYEGTELIYDADVQAIKDAWIAEIDEKLGQKVGVAEVVLDNYDAEGNRMVRGKETNTGDFCADALYYLFDDMDMDVDVSIMNGGGIRNRAITGDITYKICKDIHDFGNVACLQTVSGQQILDALEWGSRQLGNGEENGGFLQVSGLTYHINTSIPCTVQEDENGIWTGGPTGEYRVHEVKVYNKDTNEWEDLKLDGEYNLAGYNYTLRDLGDGYAMFEGAVNVLDYVMEDYMVLANYVQGFENGIVGADNSPLLEKYPGFVTDYSETTGSGRIQVE